MLPPEVSCSYRVVLETALGFLPLGFTPRPRRPADPLSWWRRQGFARCWLSVRVACGSCRPRCFDLSCGLGAFQTKKPVQSGLAGDGRRLSVGGVLHWNVRLLPLVSWDPGPCCSPPPPAPRARAEPGRRPALCPPGATRQPPAWEQPHGPGGPERLPAAARPLLASPPARCCGQFGVQHAQGLRPVLEAHGSPSHVAVGTRDSMATSDGSRPPSCLPPGW